MIQADVGSPRTGLALPLKVNNWWLIGGYFTLNPGVRGYGLDRWTKIQRQR